MRLPQKVAEPDTYRVETHRLHRSFSVERDPRASSRPVAQSVSALAHRDLYRTQDAEHWLPGVLGIYLARTAGTNAISHLDRRDGALCAGKAQEPVVKATVAESLPPACPRRPTTSLLPMPGGRQSPDNPNCRGWRRIRPRRLPHRNGKRARWSVPRSAS
jgi:hypothetical protein